MSNVTPMHRNVIASNLLREEELEAQIIDGRERHAEAFDEFERREPSLIALDSSLWARFLRWVQS